MACARLPSPAVDAWLNAQPEARMGVWSIPPVYERAKAAGFSGEEFLAHLCAESMDDPWRQEAVCLKEVRASAWWAS